jgi:septum formation protein
MSDPAGRPEIRLVSASPRRRELLEKLNIPYRVTPVDIHEDLSRDEAPEKTAVRISGEKMSAYLEQSGGEKAWALSADTFIRLDGINLGKPGSREDARGMLKLMSGRSHHVYTGLTLLSGRTGRMLSRFALTEVTFSPITDRTMEWYLDTGEWKDAAGAYRIQERGEILVFSINGPYSNVVGLPLSLLYGMLQDTDYPV